MTTHKPHKGFLYVMDTQITVYPLPQSAGRVLYGARVGGYVVAHGFTTAKRARKAAVDFLLVHIIKLGVN